MVDDVEVFFVPLSKFGPPALLYVAARELDDSESYAQAVLIPPAPAKGANGAYSRLAHLDRKGESATLREIVQLEIRADIRALILEVPPEERVDRIETRAACEGELRIAATVERYQSRAEAGRLAKGEAIQRALLTALGVRKVVLTANTL